MRTSSTVPKTVVRERVPSRRWSRAPCRPAVGDTTRVPHLHSRDAASGPGGADVVPRGLWSVAGTRSGEGAVARRWRMPARTEAERTRELLVLHQRRRRFPWASSYGIMTVRTVPHTHAPKTALRRGEHSAILGRHAQRFRELK